MLTKQDTITLPVQELRELLERIESLEEAVRLLREDSDSSSSRREEENSRDPLKSFEASWQDAQAGKTYPTEQLWDGKYEVAQEKPKVEVTSSRDFLLSIAGTFSSGTEDTSENAKSIAQNTLLKKYER